MGRNWSKYWKWKYIYIYNIYIESCGKNKVGLKYRKCKINSNNEPYWEKEFNNCNFSSELVLSVTLCTLAVVLLIIGLIVYILIKKRKNYEMEVRNQKDNRVI